MNDLTRTAPWRKVILAAMVALLLAAMYQAGRIGLADIAGLAARLRLEKLAALGVSPAPAAWASLRDRFLTVKTLTPENPQLYEFLGSQYLQRALRPNADPIFAQPYDRQALGYYRQAAQMRPTSSYVYASILLAKHGLNEVDAEFYRALNNAAEYGPWEPDVLDALLMVGTARWSALDPAAQAVVRANADRAVELDPARAEWAARRNGYLPLLCELAAKKLAKHCTG